MNFLQLLFIILLSNFMEISHIFPMGKMTLKSTTEKASRKRMFKINLTRTIEAKWITNQEQYLQQAQQLMDESQKEKYNAFPIVKESLKEKAQFMHRILTMPDKLDQEWLIDCFAEDYYVWQANIGKHNNNN